MCGALMIWANLMRFGGRFVTNALMIGSVVGAIIGLLHARRAYIQQVSEFPQKLIEQPVAVRDSAGSVFSGQAVGL